MTTLHPQDNEFFEEYKRLDRLCGDMYGCRNGVSAYLEAMERKSAQGQRYVGCWDSDYRMLKRVRWVRNQIAHDSGVYQLSEPSDLAFIQDFYNRIFAGEDALTRLRKANERVQSRTQPRTQYQTRDASWAQNVPVRPRTYPRPPVQPPKENPGWLRALAMIALVLLSILFLFFGR